MSGSIVLLLSVLQAPGGAPAYQIGDYEETFEALQESRPTPEEARPVENVILRRGGVEILLSSGSVVLLPPLRGRPAGAVFEGRGRLRLAPPIEPERRQLERIFDGPSIDLPFRSAALLFTDTTHVELGRAAGSAVAQASSQVVDVWSEALAWMSDRKRRQFDAVLMSAFLSDAAPPVFHAHIRPEKGDPVFVRVDHGAREEVSFGRKSKAPGPSRYEVVVQYHLADHYTPDKLLHEASERTAYIDAYRIRTEIDGGGGVTVRATVEVNPLTPGGAWVPLSLFKELQVDSVRVEGEALPFVRGDDATQLWIRLPPDAEPGTPLNVDIAYHGDLIERVEDWWVLRSSAEWYPRGERGPARFDLTFVADDKFILASVGRRVEEERTDGKIRTRWVTDGPVPHASFNVGEFDVQEIEDSRTPPITVLFSEYAHDRLRQAAADAGIFLLEQREMGEAVGRDLVGSIAFFQERFGPLDADHLWATEVLGLHGQAFPGLLHLSWSTFQWTAEAGHDETFRAHEVAHRWWGLGVDFRSYRDEWLSEGLAEFSGLWYLQTTPQGFQRYGEIMDEYRSAILDRRGKTGPVWLGRRVVESGDREGADDYQTIVYQKGAWIFHMLRHLMMDLDRLDTSAFDRFLQDLYVRFAGSKLSTEEFRGVVEEHIGIDMGWFFREWVYGTDVPTYRVEFQGEETPEGYRVRGTVRQEDVPEGFTMYVPILVDFGEDGWARLRVQVDKPVTIFDLPVMPRKPDDIRFNDMDAVLARVEQKKWS